MRQVISLVSGLGVSGVLILLVYGLIKGWFVTGREHSILTAQYTSLQTLYQGVQEDLRAMRGEQSKLRDRDEKQQDQINELNTEVAEERQAKLEAIAQYTAVQKQNEGMRQRIADLERTTGVVPSGNRS